MSEYIKYWTGLNAEAEQLNFNEFPIRCYFDNDSDELINHNSSNGKVNIEVYHELLKSLKTMGFNAVDIHDQLGRAEFYLWESYKKNWNYEPDINHIEKIIDLIHSENMLVQIPMYLAWAFNPIGEDAECYVKNKELWIRKWEEYMDSPLGKGDIFLLRPRSVIYDRHYRCECAECQNLGVGQIMTEAFEILENIILKKNPNAKLICDLYAEGLELFDNGLFTVSNNWTIMYADNGFGKLTIKKPIINVEYDYGIYFHAGFWLNHTVQDPHLTPLADAVKKAKEYKLTDYMLVNGQNFKSFLLNIEAIMHMASMDDFDLDVFIEKYFNRLFGLYNNRIISYIKRLENFHLAMKLKPAYLSPKLDYDRGFQANMIHILYPLITKINGLNNDGDSYSEEALPYALDQIEFSKNDVEEFLVESSALLDLISEIGSDLEEEKFVAFDDQYIFPMKLLHNQLELIYTYYEYLDNTISLEAVLQRHQEFYDIQINGSSLKSFEKWNHPTNQRMHHAMPNINIFN